MRENVKIAGGINLVAGLWLIASAFVMAAGFYSNPFIVGTLVAVFALIELVDTESSMWVGWVSGLLGFWLLISPLAITMATGAVWNSVILGLIVLGFSLWGMMSSPSIGRGHPSMS